MKQTHMSRHLEVARSLRAHLLGREEGYVLPLAILMLVALGIMAAVLLASITVNQQHVSRDRSFTQSLAVAEAGLNQYLWMVASGQSTDANDFRIPGNPGPDLHVQTIDLTASGDATIKGTYTIEVTPPSATNSLISVKVTGEADSPVEVPRTVFAQIGRPAFSEYVLLVDDDVYIGGPLSRVWHGKTHSNTGIRIETANIIDTVSCAQDTYSYGSQSKNGIWSQDVPANDPSRALWKFPVPPIDFDIVTSDFVKLNGFATGQDNLPYVTPAQSGWAHGWYIKINSNRTYQVAQVNNASGGYAAHGPEWESKSWNTGNERGGYLVFGTLSSPRPFPNKGVIYANDNVWVEGTNVTGRLTIACSGQLNAPGKQQATSINIVGDLTYAEKDGTVAIGLIAQSNVKIPMYAPRLKPGSMSDLDMEIDCALIAQQGAEYVSFDSSGSSSGWGPRRDHLTIFGSVSSFQTPFRRTSPIGGSSDYAGFEEGTNMYDGFLLHNPPPHFPTIGTYQILDWKELPLGQAVGEN